METSGGNLEVTQARTAPSVPVAQRKRGKYAQSGKVAARKAFATLAKKNPVKAPTTPPMLK